MAPKKTLLKKLMEEAKREPPEVYKILNWSRAHWHHYYWERLDLPPKYFKVVKKVLGLSDRKFNKIVLQHFIETHLK